LPQTEKEQALAGPRPCERAIDTPRPNFLALNFRNTREPLISRMKSAHFQNFTRGKDAG
jgi:hypothetical protein